MYVTVNGARIFFDAVGGQFDSPADGGGERRTLLVLHGGPG